MKSAKLKRTHNFHGKPKGYTFEGPCDYPVMENSWVPGVKSYGKGSTFSDKMPSVKKKKGKGY